MTIAWPEEFSAPLLDGYAITSPAEILRTDMEAGPPMARRISSSNPHQFAVRWYLTNTQYDSFQDWFDDATTGLNSGTVWFTFATGLPGAKASQVARFKNPPQATKRELGWILQGDLEVMPV